MEKSFIPKEMNKTIYAYFDSLNESSACQGTLSDGLLDIDCDLKRGIELWEAGEEAQAVNKWVCQFNMHTGHHIVNCQNALYSILMNKETKNDTRIEDKPWEKD